jgi:uncharacterized membrane protein YccC
LLALYLTGWLAMWLQLEQPSTAMITVVVVSHPHSGMVLAKSFYRALGTLAGSVCGLALLALFPQQRELFLLSLSLWLGLCAGGATLYRNFMAYGFVLAGYTAAIVTLPAIANPLNVFDSAVMRVSEVLLGLLVAGVVSDLIFPQRLRRVLRESGRAQFAQFIDFVRGSVGGRIDRTQMEQAHLTFVRAAVRLEDLRASVIFEDPEARVRSTRMRLLNQRYMAASTSFQSLHHLINRLQRGGREPVANALIALYQPLGVALSSPALQPSDASQLSTQLSERLDACASQLPALAATLRAPFEEPRARLEFETGAALVQRFTTELRDFAAVEASLSGSSLRGSVERVHFRRGNDYAGAAVAVLRTFLTMSALAAFWLASGWTSGGSAMLLAAIFSGILAASPTPVTAATYLLAGYVPGIAAGFVVVFGLLPGSANFPMLIGASAGLLLIGLYLSTRDNLPGLGTGYSFGFLAIFALKNPMVYDAARALNEGIAQLAGLALSIVAFVLVPAVTGTRWQRQRQLRRLREQVTLAASAPLEGLAYRFESVSRDLFQQVVTHTRPDSAESRNLLAWALAVHESGRAVLELRQDLAGGTLPADARAAAEVALNAVARLYREPDPARWQLADRTVRAAIVAAPPGAPARLHLYQLRSALRDDESPLATSMPPPEIADAT